MFLCAVMNERRVKSQYRRRFIKRSLEVCFSLAEINSVIRVW